MAENSKNRNFAAAKAGLPIGRETTVAHRRRNRKIVKLTKMLEENQITLREFLETFAY